MRSSRGNFDTQDFDFHYDNGKESTLTNEQVNDNIIDETKQERQDNQIEQHVFDVAIVGAGFSGLSAALLPWKVSSSDRDI